MNLFFINRITLNQIPNFPSPLVPFPVLCIQFAFFSIAASSQQKPQAIVSLASHSIEAAAASMYLSYGSCKLSLLTTWFVEPIVADFDCGPHGSLDPNVENPSMQSQLTRKFENFTHVHSCTHSLIHIQSPSPSLTHTHTKGPKYTEIHSGSIGIRCVGPEPKMIYDPTKKN